MRERRPQHRLAHFLDDPGEQVLDAEGRQVALYPFNDPIELPVMPLRDASGEVVGVLDVDSDRPGAFGEVDVVGLETVRNVIDQIVNGSESVIGLMLESNLHEGNQKYTGDKSALKYGVSITDECISWETTEELLLSAHAKRMQTAGATVNRAS